MLPKRVMAGTDDAVGGEIRFFLPSPTFASLSTPRLLDNFVAGPNSNGLAGDSVTLGYSDGKHQ